MRRVREVCGNSVDVIAEVSDESSRNTPMSFGQDPVTQVAGLASHSDGEDQ